MTAIAYKRPFDSQTSDRLLSTRSSRSVASFPMSAFGNEAVIRITYLGEDSLKLSSQSGWNKASLAHHFGVPKEISIR